MVRRLCAVIRPFVLALTLVCVGSDIGRAETPSTVTTAASVPVVAEPAAYVPFVGANQFGNMAQYWDFVCTTGFSTNFLDVIQNLIEALSNLNLDILDLSSLLSINFEIGDITQCLPSNIQLPSLQLPGFSGFLNCFQSLPDLSGIFGSMASCVGNITANFPNLSGFLTSFDLGSLMSCLQNQVPSGNISVNIPDLLGNIMSQLEAILDSLNGIDFQFPQIRDLFNWQAQICGEIQVGGGTNGGFPMSGASYATSSSTAQSSTTVGFQFQPPSAPNAAGARVAAAAAASQMDVRSVELIVASKKKIVSIRGPDGKTKLVRLMKSLSLKRQSVGSFTGRINYKKLRLPKGPFVYTILVTLSNGKPVPIGGGEFNNSKDYSRRGS